VPVELKSVEEFREVARRAIECRVKKSKKGDVVKLKARTKRYLYTLKVPAEKLEEVLKEVECKKIVYIDEGKVEERSG